MEGANDFDVLLIGCGDFRGNFNEVSLLGRVLCLRLCCLRDRTSFIGCVSFSVSLSVGGPPDTEPNDSLIVYWACTGRMS